MVYLVTKCDHTNYSFLVVFPHSKRSKYIKERIFLYIQHKMRYISRQKVPVFIAIHNYPLFLLIRCLVRTILVFWSYSIDRHDDWWIMNLKLCGWNSNFFNWHAVPGLTHTFWREKNKNLWPNDLSQDDVLSKHLRLKVRIVTAFGQLARCKYRAVRGILPRESGVHFSVPDSVHRTDLQFFVRICLGAGYGRKCFDGYYKFTNRPTWALVGM